MADSELKSENLLDKVSDSVETQAKKDIPENSADTKENDNMAKPGIPALEKEKTIVDVDDFKNDPAYSDPLPDPYGRAIKYLEKHNIMQLFQSLTSSIVYHKPEDPISYLMTEVARIKKERDGNKEKEEK